MTDSDETRAQAQLDQHGAEWRSKVAGMVKVVRRDLLPLDSGGFGGAIADLAKHLHAIAVAGHPPESEEALKEMTTLAATALLRLAVVTEEAEQVIQDRDRVLAQAEEAQAAVRDIYRRFRHLLPEDMEGAPE